jgi:hypothetical protein
MYDVRSKQAFIYRSNSLKEIAGGSILIRDCFKNYLYPAAKYVGSLNHAPNGIFADQDVPFTPEGFEQHIKDGYIG